VRVLPPIGKTNPHARRLRQGSTDAERLLWWKLRNRQLGGFKFRRQVTIGSYVVDFLCVEAGLAVEADGGQHTVDRDAKRSAYLEARGLRVLRFWNNEVLGNPEGVLETILVTAHKGKEEGKPSPCPLPLAGEEIK
jgi:adenine-specific DNA-methyltransferase